MEKFSLKNLIWRFNSKSQKFEFCYPQKTDDKIEIVPISVCSKAKDETKFNYRFVFQDGEFSGRACKFMILPKSDISGTMSITNAFEAGFKAFGIAGEDFCGIKIYNASQIDGLKLSRDDLMKIEGYAARETEECVKLDKLMGYSNNLETLL